MSKPSAGPPGPPSLEEELALLLAGTAARREEELERIRRLGDRVDPDRLLAVFRRQQLLALLGTRLDGALQGGPPAEFRRAVGEQVEQARRRGALFGYLTSELCLVLEGSGVEVMSLKGVGMAERIHGDPGLRSSQSDIDLLVRPGDLQDAVMALTATGCQVLDNVDWGNRLPHYHSRLVIAEPVEARVELHWRLHWYERRFAQEMLARSGRDDSGFRIPEPIDELAALLLIFARDGYFGLRIAADIAAWWDKYGDGLPAMALEPIVEEHPKLRSPILAAVDVLDDLVGLPACRLVDPERPRPRRVRVARRLSNWTARAGKQDFSTNVTLNDLLLTPWSALRVFFRHYYLQPLDHYRIVYGWPEGRGALNRARRLAHAGGRMGRTFGRYLRRLWQLRGGRAWDPVLSRIGRSNAVDPAEARVLIVSPVRNEGRHIERVVRAMAAQSRPPDLWIIADDGSEDDTVAVLRELESEVSFMRVIELPPVDVAGRDRLACALEAKAFNRALRGVDLGDFTHIGKLDGDIELPADYFERLLEQMWRDPQLGIVGGSIVERTGPTGKWRSVTAPWYHVHGALKLYTRECYEAVGGIRERLGWDTIDEAYARMRGFVTCRDRHLVVRHLRPTGSADGRVQGRIREGQCAYISRYSPLWILLRSAKVAAKKEPLGLSGAAFVWGYLSCRLYGLERVDDDEFKRFVRAEHRQRLRGALKMDRAAVGSRVPAEQDLGRSAFTERGVGC